MLKIKILIHGLTRRRFLVKETTSSVLVFCSAPEHLWSTAALLSRSSSSLRACLCLASTFWRANENPPGNWSVKKTSYCHHFLCHVHHVCTLYIQCVAKKVSPKVICHFLSNRLEFLREILHIYYLFIYTWKCQAAFDCLQLLQSYRNFCVATQWLLHIQKSAYWKDCTKINKWEILLS